MAGSVARHSADGSSATSISTPLWSLGHHQCRWKDYSQDEFLAIGRQYREKNLPCDSLWLDIGFMDGFRVFTWN